MSIKFLLFATTIYSTIAEIPLVINTWDFIDATEVAWESVYKENRTAIDSIVLGCNVCERLQCDGSVGFGGSPDERGDTTLDAMIMDGTTMNVGSVAGLRTIKDAILAAKLVLENTEHTLLVGPSADDFAVMMGMTRERLSTPESIKMWKEWHGRWCQPNFWRNVHPDPTNSCGPYRPISENDINPNDYGKHNFGPDNHDTIGMIVIDKRGKIASGTSTNGATHKIPGRVGDSPITGSGSYADGTVGAASATGEGDVMMRFLPSLLAVEFMRSGDSPEIAARKSINRITPYYPHFSGAVIAATITGQYGAACHGMETFPYSVYASAEEGVVVKRVQCI